MKELGEEVKKTIQSSLDEADDSVAVLTLKKTSLEKELDMVRNELNFIKTAETATELQKKELVEIYQAKKDSAKIELEEIIRLLAY